MRGWVPDGRVWEVGKEKELPTGPGLSQPKQGPRGGTRGVNTPTYLLPISYLWPLWMNPTESQRQGILMNGVHAGQSDRAMHRWRRIE